MPLFLKKTDNNFDDIKALERINTDSFPPPERMTIDRLLDLSKKDCFDLLLAYDEKLIGFTLLAVYSRSLYIFLLAVDKNMRSKGYGGKILDSLKKIYPDKQIVLDLEAIENTAPNLPQRIKRKQFYLKNGYYETNCFMDYIGIKFEVLCNKPTFDGADFTALLNRINCEGFSLKIYTTKR